MKPKLMRLIVLSAALSLAVSALVLAQADDPAHTGEAPEAARLAAKVVGLAAGVLLILQGIKRVSDQWAPNLISGKVAVYFAVALSVLGNIAAADPQAGLLTIILSALGTLAAAAGGHDLLTRISARGKLS